MIERVHDNKMLMYVNLANIIVTHIGSDHSDIGQWA